MELFTDNLKTQYLKENDLVIDIESTGVHREFCQIQVVGLLSNKDSDNFLQLTAQDSKHEKELLERLKIEMEGKNIISFNGINFDLPFIYARMLFHGIEEPTISGHFDIYTYLIENRFFFDNQGFSLQSMEQTLGLDRKENFELPSDQQFYSVIEDVKFAQICLHNKYDLINTEKLLSFTNELRQNRILELDYNSRIIKLYLKSIKLNNNKCSVIFESNELASHYYNQSLISLIWKDNKIVIEFPVVEGYIAPNQLAYVHIQSSKPYLVDSSSFSLDPRLLVILFNKKIVLKNVLKLSKMIIKNFINKE